MCVQSTYVSNERISAIHGATPQLFINEIGRLELNRACQEVQLSSAGCVYIERYNDKLQCMSSINLRNKIPETS